MRKSCFALAVVITAITDTSAFAADWYTGQRTPPSTESWIIDVDASVTVTSKDSIFGSMSGTFAPAGNLRQSGYRARMEGIVGTYSYEASVPIPNTIRSVQETGTLAAGYEWVSRDSILGLFAGVTIQNTSLSSPDPYNSVNGTDAGLHLSGKFYTRPVPDMMIAGHLSYATLHNTYYGRVKFGWALFDDLYLGPELTMLGDDFYSQYRIGAHVTGLRLGTMRFGLSGGFLQDRSQGSGSYGIVDARVGF